MDPILDAIDEALAQHGLSDAAASKLAVGNYALLKNMRAARGEDKRYSFQALSRLAEVLGLECYFGPVRDAGAQVERADPSEFAQIPLHAALVAAGDGVSNGSETVVEYLAFRRDWLRRLGVAAADAKLARVQGDSMQPSLWHGDMILINTKSKEPPVRQRDARDQRRSPIYALIDNGEARVKRVERPNPDQVLLSSDNPDFAPELRQGADAKGITIIGKVLWWGHTNRE